MKQRLSGALPLVLGGIALTSLAVLTIPQERTLGSTTRLVILHGSLIWTSILLALLGGILSVVLLRRVLARRRTGPARAGTAEAKPSSRLRSLVPWSLSLATLYWVSVLGLSFPVMNMSWGGVLWDEGRLVMTMVVVFLYLVAWGAAFASERAEVAAAGHLVTTAAVLVLLVLVPARFHPDSPVFSSGDPRFIGGFLASLAGLALFTAGLLYLRASDDSSGRSDPGPPLEADRPARTARSPGTDIRADGEAP